MPDYSGNIGLPDSASNPQKCDTWNGEDEPCFVYVIACEGLPGFAKVGISRDPEARANTLQSAHPFLVYVHSAHATRNRSDALRVESVAHSIMDDARALREWFSVAPDVADGVVRRSAELASVDAPDRDVERAAADFFEAWRGAA